MNRPLSILQFWDKNPLVPIWIDRFLPINRLIVDFVVSCVGLIVTVGIAVVFNAYVLENEFLVVSTLLLACAYFPGGWWGRMAKASIEFQFAKQKEREANVRE